MTTDALEKTRRRRMHIVSAVGALLTVSLGVFAYSFWPTPPPPIDAAPSVLVKFAASDKFVDLPESERLPYVQAMMDQGALAMLAASQQAGLSPQQMRKAYDASVQAVWGARIDGYFRLPEGKAREAYFDKMIGDMDAQRAKFFPKGMAPAAPGGYNSVPGARGSGAGGRMMSPERQKNRVENVSPTRRVESAEFMAALIERREAKGMPALR